MDVLFSIPVLIIFSILFSVTLHFLFQQKKQHLRPPSPLSLPILGHLHLLKIVTPQALHNLSTKYGPIVSLQFGTRPILVVSSPSLAEECFTKTNDIVFANRPESVATKHLSYNYTSLGFVPYGDSWRNLRRVTATQIFSSGSLNQSSSIWTQEIHYTVKKLFADSSDHDEKAWKVVDMNNVFMDLVFNVMMKMVAGKRWPSDQSAELFCLRPLMDVCDYIPILKWFRLGALEKDLIDLQNKRDKFFQVLIDETRKMEGGPYTYGKRRTIIEALLSLQHDQPENYTDEIIKGIILVMFTAGVHTSALTMEWAMSLLLNHPEVLQKARNEIDKHVTQLGGHMIQDSDLSKLPYLYCIISEILRMFPAAPILVPHYSSEDCTIGGYKVTKGTTLLVNVWAIHRDPKIWEDPTKFMPERFEGIDEGGCNDGFKFLPFGKGRRSCPGAAMAMRFVGLTLATLIQCFEWERVGSDMVNLEAKSGLTLTKARPLEALYKPSQSTIKLISQL